MPRRFIDRFLGALAVVMAVLVLFRRDDRPTDADESHSPVPETRKEWAGGIVRTIRREVQRDETVIVAAAIAFYAMLALLPAATATVSIYGLVLDPSDVADQVETITDVLPDSVDFAVTSQIENLATTPDTGLSIGFAVSALGALWVASGGTRALLHGIHIVYNVEERRPWAVQRAIAYGLTLAFIVFSAGTIAVVTFLPGWLEDLGFEQTGVTLVQIARWPVIFVLVVAGLSLLYRIGPNRPSTTDDLLLPGAITAAVVWMLATVGLSVYTGTGLSSFDVGTYGILVYAVVLLVWFFASGFAILLGAEVNATLESNRRINAT